MASKGANPGGDAARSVFSVMAGAPWYLIAILVALLGMPAAALILVSTNAGGSVLETVLTLVFVLQAALVAIAFASTRLSFLRITGAIGALLAALGVGMILFVYLQCRLNGVCL